MKKILSLVLVACLAGFAFTEEATAVKPTLTPYGFIKGDMIYSTNSVTVFGGNTIVSPAIATGVKDVSEVPFLSFTAQHSRVGLAGSGGVGDVKVGGLVEIDFFSNANDANTKPRIRQAYAWCQPAKALSIKIGQQWDIFSPLNPSTNNTNANLWYSGNYGFRRPQFRLGFVIPMEGAKPGLDLVVAEGSKETGAGPGLDNIAEVPQFQGRLYVGFLEKMAIGVSTLVGPYGDGRELKTWGFAADLNLPFHPMFGVIGEFGMGSNLNNANIFSIAGSGSYNEALDTTFDMTSLGFWFNAISKPADFLNIVIGLGLEKNTTEDLADGKLESNMAFYTDLIFPMGKFFSLTFEWQLINTKYANENESLTDDQATRKAHVIDLAGKVVF